MSVRQKTGIILGLFVFVILLLIPVPDDMNPKAMRAIAVSMLMAIFWVTEAISIFSTAFIPIALFPLMGVLNANHIVLLLLGAFLVAKAIETNNLHKRIALFTILLIGTNRQHIILSFMIATAFLSMWTSNNSTTLMILPIGLAIIQREHALGVKDAAFGSALMLSIAYSASIGGTGTLVGTPPNLLFVSTMKEIYPDSPDIVFIDWLKIGLPFVAVFLPIAWFFIIKYFKVNGPLHGSDDIIENEYHELGLMSVAEKRVLVICICYALGFIFRRDMQIGDLTIPGWSDILGVHMFVKDSTVAFLAATLIFLLPNGYSNGNVRKNKLLEWDDAKTIPWGIAMLIGGGLAIAAAFRESGLIVWIGSNLELSGISVFLILLLAVTSMVLLTEINSNTASTAVFLPVLAGVSNAGHFHPYLLMVPATIAASCAFMLPSGTGPNASILASGEVTIPEMAKCGFWLNIFAIIVIVNLLYFIIIPTFEINGTAPNWM